MTDRVWVDELAFFAGSAWWPRRHGKITAQREVFDQSAAAGEHAHWVSSTGGECVNGDDTCPVWRSQQ